MPGLTPNLELPQWTEQIVTFLEAENGFGYRVISSLLVIFCLWLLRHITLRAVWSKVGSHALQYTWRKMTSYLVIFLGILFLAGIWIDGITGIGTFLGLFTAGVAIALRDPLVCISAWIFIIIRRPFRVGDRIQVGDSRGDVIDIGVFQFSLLEIGNWVQAEQSTGRILELPNSRVFTDTIGNYTLGFPYIWNEIPVLITFESDWKLAKQLLHTIVSKHAEELSRDAELRIKEAAREFMIFYSKLTPIVYTSVEDCGVLLSIRYMCKPHERRGTTEKIWEDILDKFDEYATIDFAYPTQRFYGLPPVPGSTPNVNIPDPPQEP